MSIFEAIVYGVIQGFTEFLPISSTAHLVLLPWFMGWKDPGLAFDVAIHLGTLIALFIYFRADWYALITSSFGIVRGRTHSPDAKMAMMIVVATIPAGVAGVLFEDIVENALRTPAIIGFMLIALALLLVAAEFLGHRKKSLDEITWTDAIGIGVAQACALIPGVSRSGSTITAGLFFNLKREAAARFSFYLSGPIIAAAVAKKLYDILKAGVDPQLMVPIIVGIITSGIVGYLSIAFLMRYLQTHNTYLFVVYRILLGIVVLVAFWSGFR